MKGLSLLVRPTVANGPTLSPCVRFSVCPPSAAGLEDSRKHSINVRPPGVSVAFSFSSFCFGFYWFQFYTVISDTLEHSREKFFNLRITDFFLLYAPTHCLYWGSNSIVARRVATEQVIQGLDLAKGARLDKLLVYQTRLRVTFLPSPS